MTFWRSTLRRARKLHRCEACCRRISIGESSYEEAGVTSEGFSSYRLCLGCHDLVGRLYANGAITHWDEPWFLHDLSSIAHDAEESWPPLTNAQLDLIEKEQAHG